MRTFNWVRRSLQSISGWLRADWRTAKSKRFQIRQSAEGLWFEFWGAKCFLSRASDWLGLYRHWKISPVSELSFLPAPYGGWTRAGEKRVQDNLHPHAQNTAIFPQIGGKTILFFYIACLTWTSLYGMSGSHYWHPVIQQDQLSVETEVNYKITPPSIKSDQSKLITWYSKIPGDVMTFIPRARVEYIYNSRHLARKYSRIFVRGHYLFREENSVPRAKLEENCELRGRDKYSS